MTGGRRRGFTLVELIVTLVVAGLVGATGYRVLLGAQRFYRAASQVLDVQQNVRAAAQVLAGELRALDPSDGDLIAMSDTALTLKADRGFGVLCGPADPATGRILLASPLVSGWRAIDPAKDSALLFRDGDTLTASDDAWLRASVATTGVGTCPGGAPAIRLTLSGVSGGASLLSGVGAGSPLRTFEVTRYRLYEDGEGTAWLGSQTRSGGSWSATSPIAGPLDPGDGIAFAYLDAAGAPTADRAAVRQVRLTVRGRSIPPVVLADRAGVPYRDSIATSVFLRNGAPR